jgi:F-type H+-transporting ATPase subunit gamma
MEMVSASKMRRAQEQTLASRPYEHKLAEIMHVIGKNSDAALHPLLQTPDSDKYLVVIISSDKGLAGPLSTNLFKRVEEFVHDKDCEFITFGKKAREYITKTNRKLIAEFSQVPDRVRMDTVLPAVELLMESFKKGEYKAVIMAHMEFISTLAQKPVLYQLLPLSKELLNEQAAQEVEFTEYTFEPNPKDVLDSLLPNYIELHLFQTVLDSKASEHSARMVAMKNASDNAKEIMGSLQLVYNKSRQASITKELLDITTAMLSVDA